MEEVRDEDDYRSKTAFADAQATIDRVTQENTELKAQLKNTRSSPLWQMCLYFFALVGFVTFLAVVDAPSLLEFRARLAPPKARSEAPYSGTSSLHVPLVMMAYHAADEVSFSCTELQTDGHLSWKHCTSIGRYSETVTSDVQVRRTSPPLVPRCSERVLNRLSPPQPSTRDADH